MKPHKILKTFPGSQTGHDHDTFVAGTTRDLSTGLAAIVVKEGWAEPVHIQSDRVVHGAGHIRPHAIADGEMLDEGELPEGGKVTRANPADQRETKVSGPEETKVNEPAEVKSLDEMTFPELKAAAKLRGINTFGMSQVKLLEALKA